MDGKVKVLRQDREEREEPGPGCGEGGRGRGPVWPSQGPEPQARGLLVGLKSRGAMTTHRPEHGPD